jgi:hypothetical protein
VDSNQILLGEIAARRRNSPGEATEIRADLT